MCAAYFRCPDFILFSAHERKRRSEQPETAAEIEINEINGLSAEVAARTASSSFPAGHGKGEKGDFTHCLEMNACEVARAYTHFRHA